MEIGCHSGACFCSQLISAWQPDWDAPDMLGIACKGFVITVG